jgi:hypothetical protein
MVMCLIIRILMVGGDIFSRHAIHPPITAREMIVLNDTAPEQVGG